MAVCLYLTVNSENWGVVLRIYMVRLVHGRNFAVSIFLSFLIGCWGWGDQNLHWRIFCTRGYHSGSQLGRKAHSSAHEMRSLIFNTVFWATSEPSSMIWSWQPKYSLLSHFQRILFPSHLPQGLERNLGILLLPKAILLLFLPPSLYFQRSLISLIPKNCSLLLA